MESQLKIAEFMKKRRKFLVYLGNPGLGKTFLCASLFEWAIRGFTSFRYYRERELQKKLLNAEIEHGWDTYKYLLDLTDDPVIFLDDVGKTKYSEPKEDHLFDFIDIRLSSCDPTIITSNLSSSEFRKIYGERLCSRLFCKDNIIIEEMSGVDRRME